MIKMEYLSAKGFHAGMRNGAEPASYSHYAAEMKRRRVIRVLENLIAELEQKPLQPAKTALKLVSSNKRPRLDPYRRLEIRFKRKKFAIFYEIRGMKIFSGRKFRHGAAANPA
jgi:hypothetical protein